MKNKTQQEGEEKQKPERLPKQNLFLRFIRPFREIQAAAWKIGAVDVNLKEMLGFISSAAADGTNETTEQDFQPKEQKDQRNKAVEHLRTRTTEDLDY